MPRDSSGAPRRARHASGKLPPLRTQQPAKRTRTRLRRVDETSAGGLVVDLSGDVPYGVIIGRTDRRGRLLWSLPKGHVEPGETAEQAAMREVAEETGIRGEVLASLGTIDFWFIADRRRVHKTVHHFLLGAVGGELSDADIEVTEVALNIEYGQPYPSNRFITDGMGFQDLLQERDCYCNSCGLSFQEHKIQECGQTYVTFFWESKPNHNWLICMMRRFLIKRGAL